MRILNAGASVAPGLTQKPRATLWSAADSSPRKANLRRAFWHRPHRLPWEETLAVLALCFFAVQGAVPGIAPAQALATHLAAATSLMRVGGMAAQALVYGGIVLLLLRARHSIEQRLPSIPLVLLFTLWVLATALWSLDPLLTLRRGVEFALAGGFGLYLAVRFPLQKQLRIFWIALLLLSIASVLAVFAFPATGLDRSAGHLHDWKGVFTQKNASGRMMVLATALLLVLRRGTGASKTLFRSSIVASAALFALVLYKSGSRSAWLLEAVVLAVAFLLWLLRCAAPKLRALLLVLAAEVGLIACIAAYAERARILEHLGRGVMLSGRVGIWAAVWSYICQRPLLGWGYAAFWRGWTGPSFQVSSMVHFLVFHAHDGYLDLWLQTGLLGLLLFALIGLQAFVRVARRVGEGEFAGRSGRCNYNDLLWPLMVLVIVGLYGIDENTILIVHGIFWPLVVMALVLLGKQPRGRAQRRDVEPRWEPLNSRRNRGLRQGSRLALRPLACRRSHAARALSTR